MAEWIDVEETLAALSAALNTYDWRRAQDICSDLIARLRVAREPYPEKPAKRILSLLRRKRRFESMERVADAFLQNGQTAPQIVRQYAQAMIDQGNFTAPHLVLKSIAEDYWSPLSEKAESNGLLGRIHKQLYVNVNGPSNERQLDNLRQAVRRYYDTYVIDPGSFLWHGINSVALLARAARDGVKIEGFPKSGEIARQISHTLRQRGDLEYWDRATAIENAIALGDWKDAYEHFLLYANNSGVDAFEIASLLRQLIEVWQLSEQSEPGSVLLPALRAALLQREGGSAEVEYLSVTTEANTAKSAEKKLEKAFGDDSYQPLEWYKTGLTRCKAVARIESISGHRLGTGFLVRASDFFPGHNADEVLLLTNAHVISPEDKPYFGAQPPQAIRVIFEASKRTCTEVEVVWSSPPDELDATFATLKPLKPKCDFCPLTPPANAFNRENHQRVYIIGYPLGGKLSFSLQDSIWLDTDGRVLHYRTPTDPGSSGSPVFDQHYWTLLGLHRSGRTDMERLGGQSGTYEANAGVAIGAVQAATRGAARSATP